MPAAPRPPSESTASSPAPVQAPSPADQAATRPVHRFTHLGGLWQVLRGLGVIRAPVRPPWAGAPGHAPDPANSLSATAPRWLTTHDGLHLPITCWGQRGPAVVLVHGLGCTHAHWRHVARRLARYHRVYAWDARGHGRSTLPPGASASLPHLAQDLHHLLDTLALPQAVLVGHSMGALTVLSYLQTHGTARASAVVLIDQSPKVVTDADWRLGLFGGCSAGMLGQLISHARSDLLDTVIHQLNDAAPAWLHRCWAPGTWGHQCLRTWLGRWNAQPLLDLAESLANADLRPVLPRLDVPLMVVLGGRSPHYAGVPLADYYARTVPHAHVLTYPHSGHSPHLSESRRLAGDVRAFLKGHDVGGG